MRIVKIHFVGCGTCGSKIETPDHFKFQTYKTAEDVNEKSLIETSKNRVSSVDTIRQQNEEGQQIERYKEIPLLIK